MRIYFIYPNIESYYSAGGFHHGIASISSVLKQNGHETRLFSITKHSEIKIVLREIENFNPSIVAFSATTSQFRYVQRISKEIKEFFDSITVGGGASNADAYRS